MEDIRQRIQEMILHGGGTPHLSTIPIPGESAAATSTTHLNKDAKPFSPSSSLTLPTFSRLVTTASGGNTPAPEESEVTPGPDPEEGEDVEMGEVSEVEREKPAVPDTPQSGRGSGKESKRRAKEDLEEGEASDGSSDLTDLSDLPNSSKA